MLFTGLLICKVVTYSSTCLLYRADDVSQIVCSYFKTLYTNYCHFLKLRKSVHFIYLQTILMPLHQATRQHLKFNILEKDTLNKLYHVMNSDVGERSEWDHIK
jgi:hypothetical protein